MTKRGWWDKWWYNQGNIPPWPPWGLREWIGTALIAAAIIAWYVWRACHPEMVAGPW